METETIIKVLREKIKNGNTVFVCGNGGSATTAEHFTCDLFSKGIKAMCLNSNTAIMTMIANDFGYSYVFSYQLVSYSSRSGDLLIVFSYSGESKNIIRAIGCGLETITFFGEEGESPGQAEVRHLALAHEICEGL